jgi:hypothetical protein
MFLIARMIWALMIAAIMFPIGYLIGWPFGAGMIAGLIFAASPILTALQIDPKTGRPNHNGPYL